MVVRCGDVEMLVILMRDFSGVVGMKVRLEWFEEYIGRDIE